MAEAVQPRLELSAKERQVRIDQLRAELAELLAQEAAQMGVDTQAVEQECLAHIQEGRIFDAIRHYRTRMGCGLGEARDAVAGFARRGGSR